MAKEWAIKFYASTAWRKTRAAYMSTVNWTCERCPAPAVMLHHRTHLTPININDPSITLAWGNLEALCRLCHEEEHGEIRGRIKSLMNESVELIDGEVVKKMRISKCDEQRREKDGCVNVDGMDSLLDGLIV